MSDSEHRHKIRKRKYRWSWFNLRILVYLGKWGAKIASVALVAVIAIWGGHKLYKHWLVRSLIRDARHYSQQGDLRNTALCLQRVFQINPVSLEGSEMMADLLEQANSSAALSWRAEVAKLEPNQITNRFLWAKTAIRMKNFDSARLALAGISEKDQNSPEYHKIEGVLAWSSGQIGEAEHHYAEALRLEPGNPANVVNLETIRLTSTNAAVVAAALAALEQLSTNTELGPVALQHLLVAALARNDLAKATRYAREIAANPAATFDDKIGYLKLLRLAKSPDYDALLDNLKTSVAQSPADVYTLGQWLAAAEGPEAALRWAQELPLTVQTNLPTPLLITDCQMALKDWSGMLDFINPQTWGELDYYRLALETLADRSSGNETASQNDWSNTLLLSAGKLDRLTKLAELAKRWGWKAEETAVLHLITDQFPTEKWAANELIAGLYVEGNSAALQELLTKLCASNPTDFRLKNNLANVLLLRKTELTKANRLAKEAFDTSTNDPFFICTYAYSLLVDQKPAQALAVVNRLPPEYLKVPSLAAYYGTIQAELGHKTLARQTLGVAEQGKLLPEEKEMVEAAKAGL